MLNASPAQGGIDSVSFSTGADGAEVLETRQWLAAPIDEVFGFFGDAANLNELTPPFLYFRILTPLPITMQRGTLIDYRIRLRGVPMSWRTEITAWEPNRRFVDEQVRGPYRLWQHEHLFETAGRGTFVSDRVRYKVPFGRLVSAVFVRGDLRRIFEYRQQQMRRIFSEAL